MEKKSPSLPISRRVAVKSSVFGVLAASLPNVMYAREIDEINSETNSIEKVFHRYPSINDAIVEELVGASHFNLDRVKELVTTRPELARATWDWGFGDWETALGAASHVGRRDIAEFLIEHGARPDIFTFAMFGDYEAVKAMIEARPGIQSIYGPHGISLLSHAEVNANLDSLSKEEKANANKLVKYLKSLGNADPKQEHIEMKTEEKEKYLGDYMYGDGDTEGFSIQLNRRGYLSLGKVGKFGGSLYQQLPGEFEYNGISSVKILFQEKEGKVVSLVVKEPDLAVKANKI